MDTFHIYQAVHILTERSAALLRTPKMPKRFADHLSHKANDSIHIYDITKLPRPHYTKCSLVSRLPQASFIYKLLEFDNSTHSNRILEPYEFIGINISKSERQRIDENTTFVALRPDNLTFYQTQPMLRQIT